MPKQQLQGLILRCVGGFYYVQADDGVEYECRARGLFRKTGMTPLAGDRVVISTQEDGSGFVLEVLPRRNFLIRPPVANLDYLVVVASIVEPDPNLLVLDKMLVIAEANGITPLVVINKADLADTGWLYEVYQKSGYQVFAVSALQPETVEPLRAAIAGKTSAFAGNTGVGKSSLLNVLAPGLSLQTQEISKKLGRGRHTTRIASLFALPGGGYLVDTPGFSSVDMGMGKPILKEMLPDCFPEFEPYLGQCKFTSCSHTGEAGCAIVEAAGAGRIAQSRYDNYVAMYLEIKDIREWQLTKEKSKS